jgi:hypothetical protein
VEELQFVAKGQETTWWLLEPASEPTLEQTKKLGEAFGWGEAWYQDAGQVPEQLKVVWNFIQSQSQVTQLWTELASAVDGGDLTKRADWLKSVIDLKVPKATPASVASASTAPATAAEVSTPAAPAGTPAGEPAPKKPSAFARMKGGEESPAADAGAAAAAEAAAGAAPAEPRKASPFGKKAASPADATTAPTAAEPAPADTGDGATPAAATTEQLKESLTELADDPNVPISKEDVDQLLSDPNFQQNLAAAQAEIEAELEAELATAEAET